MAPKRRKKALQMENLTPSKACILNFPGGRVLTLVTPPPPSPGGECLLLRAPISKSDYKLHNIFGKYSSHNFIKIHSRMHSWAPAGGGGKKGHLPPPPPLEIQKYGGPQR